MVVVKSDRLRFELSLLEGLTGKRINTKEAFFSSPEKVERFLIGQGRKGQQISIGDRLQFFSRRPNVSKQIFQLNKNLSPVNQISAIRARLEGIDKQRKVNDQLATDFQQSFQEQQSITGNIFQRGDIKKVQQVLQLQNIFNSLIRGL
jgi:hypothetical protein